MEPEVKDVEVQGHLGEESEWEPEGRFPKSTCIRFQVIKKLRPVLQAQASTSVAKFMSHEANIAEGPSMGSLWET